MAGEHQKAIEMQIRCRRAAKAAGNVDAECKVVKLNETRNRDSRPVAAADALDRRLCVASPPPTWIWGSSRRPGQWRFCI